MARRVKADRRRRSAVRHASGSWWRGRCPISISRARCLPARTFPFEALDTLPLAAEPYAAAVDVVLECAAANFTRRAMMALLRSPHFRFDSDGGDLDRAAVSRLDQCLADQRYLGGLDRLTALTGTLTGAERQAADAALSIAQRAGAAPGTAARSSIRSICCAQFLERHDRDHHDDRRPPRARGGDDHARRSRRRLPPPRSRRHRHGRRADRRDPPMARRANVCARRRAAAAFASSMPRRRASPTSTMCR